jgi:hypothetical protein
MTTTVTVPFDINESAERIRQFEQRGIEFKVRSGLELMRAKFNLPHGGWYGFLFKANIYPSTATRRMKIARLFMQWAGTEFSEGKVISTIAMVDDEPCILHDFNNAQKVDIDSFWDELHGQDNQYLPPPEKARDRIVIVELNPSWKKIEYFINFRYKRLRKEKREEFRQWLKMQADRATVLYQISEEVEANVLTGKSRTKMLPGQSPTQVQIIADKTTDQPTKIATEELAN